MSLINKYMACAYVDGGRGPDVFDCWGLVREVLHVEFGFPLLASFGCVLPDDKPAVTLGYKNVKSAFELGELKPGSVAAGFVGVNLIHVGVCVNCDGQLKVLHTTRKHGVRFETVKNFKRLFFTLI